MTDIEFAQFWTTATLGVNFQHGYRLLDNQRDSRFIGEFKQLGCHILVKKINIKIWFIYVGYYLLEKRFLVPFSYRSLVPLRTVEGEAVFWLRQPILTIVLT